MKKKSTKPSGLLTQFIEGRRAEYQEPTKAGTPKGDPVGFMREKWHAALLSLTNLTLKERSAKARVPYGVLRVWTTQPQFKKACREIRGEFIASLESWIKERLAEDERRVHGILSLPLAEIPKAEVVHDRYPDFADASLYGDDLTAAIEKRFFPSGIKIDLGKKIPAGKEREALQILDVIYSAKGKRTLFNEEWAKAWELHAVVALQVAMNHIAKANRTEDDIKSALFFIRGIAQELEQRSPYWNAT